MIRFIIVRHGETEWNRAGLIQGQLESALNATGIAQAHALGQRLAQEPLDEIWSSDLSRARDTAEKIAQHHGIPIRFDTRLRERHFGLFQGLTFAQAERLYPQHYLEYLNTSKDSKAPEGETTGSFYDRVLSFLQERVRRAQPGQTLVLATHGGVVNCCYRFANNIALEVPRTWPVPNAALNELTFEDGAWQMPRFADVSHLNEVTERSDELPMASDELRVTSDK